MFDDVDAEAALHAARPGKQSLHRLLEAGTGAGRPDDGEVVGTAVELPVEHQERQATEVVAVQVADQHRLDLIGVDLLLAQRGQIGGPTVQQQAGRGRLVGGQGDAGLEPPPRAERIASAHRRHPHHTIIPLPTIHREGQSQPEEDRQPGTAGRLRQVDGRAPPAGLLPGQHPITGLGGSEFRSSPLASYRREPGVAVRGVRCDFRRPLMAPIDRPSRPRERAHMPAVGPTASLLALAGHVCRVVASLAKAFSIAEASRSYGAGSPMMPRRVVRLIDRCPKPSIDSRGNT